MLKRTRKMTKMLILSGLVMSAQYSFAQQIQFPDKPYTDAHLLANNCSPPVYDKMYNQAKGNFNAKATSLNKLLVKDQLEASPKEATNKMMKCVDNAVKQLDGLASNVMGIYNMITGAGNIDLAALKAKAANQLSALACNAVNNYTGNAVYSAVQPYSSAITNLPGQVTGSIGSITTPVGNINAGQMVTDAVKQQAGPQQQSTIVKDSVTNLLK